MLKSIKNFISKKKKIISLFGIMLISSLFFINSAKALNDTITIDYDNQRLDILHEKKDIIQHIVDIAEQYNIHNFSYIISANINSSNVILSVGVIQGVCSEVHYDPYITSGSSSSSYKYNHAMYADESKCTNAYFNNKFYTNHVELNLNNYDDNSLNSFYSTIQSYFTSSISAYNTLGKTAYATLYSKSMNLLDYDNVNVFVYSNSIVKYFKSKSYAYDTDLIINNQRYFFNDIVPTYMDLKSRIEPEISYSETSNTEVVNETIYTYSKNITINYIVEPSEINDYLYIYSVDEGNNWVTVSPSDDNVSWTLRVDSNKNVIGRILDKNTLENVYTSTYVVDGISKYEGLKHVVFIDNSYLNNGQDELYSFNIINYNSSKSINFQMIIDSFDETIEHVPRLIRTKGYIYNSASNSFLENSNVYFDNLSCTKESFSATRMVCTGILRSNLNGTSRYEFYFDNVDNVYIDYYDDANSNYRTYNYTDSFLKDYDKYYFNMNSDKVYISPNNINQENKEGSIIIPYYFVNNDDLKIELLDYDYTNDSIIKKYNYLPTTDEYYRKFDFKLTDNSLPVLTNRKGKYCVSYYINEQKELINLYTNGNFFQFVVADVIMYVSLGNEIAPISECREEEQVYFYVSKDFKVTQNIQGSNEDIQITDNNYHIITTIDDDFNNSNTYEIDNTNFFDSVKKAFSYFTSPIREILKMITYIWNSLNIVLKMFIIFIFVFIVGLFALRFLL